MTKLHKEAHSTLQAKPLAFANRMLALEPRYIFDAAMATELADIVHVTSDTGYSGPAAADTGAEMVAAARELSAFDAIHDGSGAPVSEAEFQSAISTYVDAHNLASANDEVAFVDSRLADLGTLISSIPDGTRIVLIDGSRDGVEQMTAALEDMQGITGVHIISHGTAGALQLGTSTLNAETMSGMYREALSGIRDNLDPDADILIYGCNFAAGQSGANAVALLAELTGADVAASDDLTGTGGDWDLEVSAGAVEAIGLSPKAWAHTLDLAITNVGVTGGPSGVTGANVNALANQILGGGVTINSATYYGGALQAATFVTGAGSSFGSNVLAFTDGAIFSTGTAVSVAGPNNSPGFTVDAPGIDNNVQFNALAGGSTRDASYITINFTPDVPPGASAGDTGRMTMQIVFGSDEYNEYVYGSVNDTMAIIVNGQNKAVVPNGLAIGIDTINAAGTYNPAFGSPTLDPNPEHVGAGFESANPSLYVNNGTGALNTQMDGFTITLPVTFDVIVGQANTITIGIADTADPLLDSWMFVKADSGQTVIIAEGDSVITPTNVPITIDVTANDFDLQGDPLTITHINDALVSPGDVITLASGATVTIGVGGSITIEGDGINPANDAFTYAITDGNGGSSLAFVNVTLTAPLINTAPVGVNDNIPATEDAPVTQNVLGNDTDVDSDPLTISGASIDWNGDGVPDPIVLGSPTAIVSSTGAAIGVITVNGNGDVTFAPSQNYTGPVPNLTYTPNDGTVDGTPATVTFGPIVPVNDAPDAVDGTVTTGYLTPVVVDFTGNDTDADGDPLTVTAATLTDPASGTLSEDPVTGVWTFTPAVGYSGDAVISYTITDQDGATDTATHTVTVANALPALTDPAPGVPGTPEIDPSDPSNLLVAATDGVPLTLAAGSYFTDPNGDPLTITPDMTGVPAWLSYDPLTQTFSGTPPVDNAGAPIVIPVVVDDGQGGVIAATLTITPSNPAPDAVDGTVTTGYLTPVVVDFTGNDTDADGDPLTVTAATLTDPASGTLSEDPVTGVWTFTPAVGYSGDAVISYTITDQDGATDMATHTVTVANALPALTDPAPGVPGTPEIDPSDPSNLLVAATDGVPLTLAAGSYFTDPNGDPLTITPDMTGVPAWLSYDPLTQTFSGTPPVDNAGAPIVIPVVVDDGQGGVIAATLTITPSNPAPDAVDGTVTTGYLTPVVVDFTGNDTDADGDPLTVTAATLTDPASGTLSEDPVTGVWTFTPAVGYSGDAVISYTITDQDGATDMATHTVTVANALPALTDPAPGVPGTPEIDPSDPSNLLVAATDGVPMSLAAGSYFTDPNGDPLTITPDMTGVPAWLSYDPLTQTFSGTPPVDNAGTAIVIPVVVDDGQGGVIAATLTITPSNPAPDAVDGTVTTAYLTPVVVDFTGNDTDADGDPLTVTAATLTDPASGTLSEDPVTGVWTFTPAVGYSGDAVISYTITDQDGATDMATHTVTVANALPALTDPAPGVPGTPEIDPSDPSNLLVAATDGVPLTLAAGSYFTDPNGDPLTITPDMTGVPAWLSYDPLTQTFSGTPPVDNAGTAIVIPVVVDDGQGGVIAATLTITPSNPAPDAVDGTVTTAYLTPVVVDFTGNDTDADGDPLTVTAATLTDPASGTLSEDPVTGVWTFTPAVGYSGDAVISYTITDQDGATDTATHTVTVARPPLAAVADFSKTKSGVAVSGNASLGDTFVQGSKFKIVVKPPHGTVVMKPDGTYRYTPKPGFSGKDRFYYRITDPTGQVVTQTVTIDVASRSLAHRCLTSFANFGNQLRRR